MKIRTKLVIVASLAGAVGFGGAGVVGCSDTTKVTCTAPSVLSSDGKSCLDVNDDLGVVTPPVADCGAAGTNTVLMNGNCVPTSAVCQVTGTTWDAAANACKPTPLGSQVGTSLTFATAYQHIFGQFPADGGGFLYQVIGGFNAQTATYPDTGLLYAKDGTPLGGKSFLARYPIGPLVPTPTVTDITHTITLGDWKACSGSAGWYKPAAKPTTGPLAGKATYYHSVDIAGCQPNSLYTVWFFYSNDGTRATSAIGGNAGPAGGLPNAFQTDDNGNGHWQRQIDSDVWMKTASPSPFLGTHGATTLPDLTANPTAGILTVVLYHDNAQSNGNLGFCESVDNTKAYDVTSAACVAANPASTPPGTCTTWPYGCGTPPGSVCNPCANPQPNVINLGRTNHDTMHAKLTDPGFPLTNLQPY